MIALGLSLMLVARFHLKTGRMKSVRVTADKAFKLPEIELQMELQQFPSFQGIISQVSLNSESCVHFDKKP